MHLKLIVIFFLGISSLTYSQDSLIVKINEFSNLLNKKPVNYLKGIDFIRYFEPDFKDSELESFYYQVSSTFLSAAGEQNASKEKYWLSKKMSLDSPVLIDKGLTDHSIIIQQSESNQVVMINENHAFPEHRVFTTSLLKELYKKGFRYLALEDLVNTDKSINERTYAKKTDGLYINEIMFADMVSQARIIGFELIPYDNNDAFDIKERDSLGINEIKKVFLKDPDAKMIIHCGFGHIVESEPSLAYYVNRDLKIDPLTISQVSHKPVICSNCDSPKIIKIKNKSELFMSGTDIQVIHPRYNYSNKRPSYLYENNRFKRIVDLKSFNFSMPMVLEVYPINHSMKDVPIDRLIVKPDQKEAVLSLREESFVLVLKNKLNEIQLQKTYITH